ncbi:hypothetical protein [Sulfitobacter sp.]|jgi:hypothetical protein|uniref:hypothetical protein n=1 Tax=Sulfitobacter sp. TaxID=1903071 RepID=UPI003003699B
MLRFEDHRFFRGEAARGADIPEAKTFASILALNKAMGSYGLGLVLLDAAAFNRSLLDMVASVEGL